MAILTLLFPKQAQALEVPMPRRRRMVQGVESSQDLARKLEVLERELEVQRAAMEKLKLLGTSAKRAPASRTRTSSPARRARSAVVSPVIPAPTTTRSARLGRGCSRRVRSGLQGRVACHKEVMAWTYPNWASRRPP